MSDQSTGSQGQLFSDAAVGAPRYDEVDTDLVGYRGPTACAAAGITYRQLDYWARTGLVAPSVRTATGSGTQRLYSFRDILVLREFCRTPGPRATPRERAARFPRAGQWPRRW